MRWLDEGGGKSEKVVIYNSRGHIGVDIVVLDRSYANDHSRARATVKYGSDTN